MKWTLDVMEHEDAGRWHVFVDGERVTNVVEASEQEGYVIAHALRDGRPFLNEDQTEAVTYRREGRVEIIDMRSWYRRAS